MGCWIVGGGPPWWHYALSGYQTPIEIPCLDGRLDFRSMQGIPVCVRRH
ncbi:MAG: hypothetical protein ACOCYP_10925 [Planctomycetota bacterium]